MTFVLIMGFDSSAKPSKIVGKTITLGGFSLRVESRERLVDCILEIPFLLKKKFKA